MKIAGYEKISLQDYPNHISSIIFTQGCNIKCPFCQNSTLIPLEAENLIKEKKIDYVAMDIKNSFSKYSKTCGMAKMNMDNINKSIELLKENKVDYEFRTTVINELHTLQDILEIIKMIGDSKYYLQNFRSSEFVLDKTLTEIPNDKLLLWNEVLKKYANVYIRGINKED